MIIKIDLKKDIGLSQITINLAEKVRKEIKINMSEFWNGLLSQAIYDYKELK